MKERRSEPRVPVRIPAGVYLKDKKSNAVDGEILNLSLAGAYIEADIVVTAGSQVMVELRFPEPNRLPATVVAWDKPTASTVVRWERLGSSGESRGFGVEFQNLSDHAKRYLEQLIKHFCTLERAGVNL